MSFGPPGELEPAPGNALPLPEAIIGPGDGTGVPDYAFTRGFYGPVATASGRTLQCSADAYSVEIYEDPDGRAGPPRLATYRFLAGLSYNYAPDPQSAYRATLLRLNVSNRDTSSESLVRHPDIYPARLLARTILYFESDIMRGYPIEFLEGNWDVRPGPNPSAPDNWRQYSEFKASLGIDEFSSEQ